MTARVAARRRCRGRRSPGRVNAGSRRGLTEEAPLAYKDVDAVVNVIHQAGLARKVARLRPLVVVKG